MSEGRWGLVAKTQQNSSTAVFHLNFQHCIIFVMYYIHLIADRWLDINL